MTSKRYEIGCQLVLITKAGATLGCMQPAYARMQPACIRAYAGCIQAYAACMQAAFYLFYVQAAYAIVCSRSYAAGCVPSYTGCIQFYAGSRRWKTPVTVVIYEYS